VSPGGGAGPRYIVAVAVIVLRRGRLLALRRAAHRDAAPGVWETVSGRLEPGEDPGAAAVRETREETGLAIDLDPRPISAYQTRRAGRRMVVIVYRGASAAGAVRRSAEHDADAWMTLREFAAACDLAPLVEAARVAAGGAAVRGGPRR
jgi:8-oxo-dGTP diphosphatase